MISSLAKRPAVKRQQKTVLKQIGLLREQMEDLNDYLNLLEARARNEGKPTFTTDEVCQQLGLVFSSSSRLR